MHTNNALLPVVNGIADAIKELNSKAQIYIDTPPNVEKTRGGYFYIKPVTVTSENQLAKAVILHAVFDVMYFPSDFQSNNVVQLYDAIFGLNFALKQITLASNVNGQYVKQGTKKGQILDAKIVDDVVHTTVRYDLYLDVEEKTETVKNVYFE